MAKTEDGVSAGVDPNLVICDLDDLTVGEIELIEDTCDMSIDSFGMVGVKKGKMLRAIAWVVKRRENPELAWADTANFRIDMSDGMKEKAKEMSGANVPPTGKRD